MFSDTQSGSGVIFDSRGFLLTNNHVVAGTSRVTVTLDDGAQFEAEVTGTDSLTDLAVLKIEGREFPWVPLADPTTVRVGELGHRHRQRPGAAGRAHGHGGGRERT